ncbi:efflux RND transporter periplasmic adaptor subunit [Alteromonas aestuariivivens]|nr:efflux RND transporter periplasmic adaptor subunit [Alteromonas aestuariivivens]
MKKLFLVLVIAGIALAIWLYSRQQPLVVTTETVGPQRVAQAVTNTRSGSVQSCRRAKLSVPVGGQIATIPVSEGDTVSEGTVLLSLFNDDIQAQLRQAQASLQSAKLNQQRACVIADTDQREATRLKTLFSRKLVSDEQLDVSVSRAKASALACLISQADTRQVEAQVELFEAQLSKTRLIAPFDGTIAEINGEIGEFATPSPPGIPTLPNVDLIDNHCFYVSAPIDEVDAGLLKLGQPVDIHIDAYRDHPFKGLVRRIAPYVFAQEKRARTVEVEVEFAEVNEPLLVGYSADVTIEIAARDQALAIPTQAIFDDNQVWVLVDSQLQQRSLQTGLSNWHITEVLQGLKAGEQIVISANGATLEPGMSAQSQQAKP